MMKVLTTLFICMCLCLSAIPTYADHFLYADWEYVLKTCVIDGCVDYAKMREEEPFVQKFLHRAAVVTLDEFNTWNKNEQMAFLINVYNACACILALENPYALTIHEFQETPDDKLFVLFEKPCSLNEIKHVYLRGRFTDERIHFALVSPASGFPRLRNEAYLGLQLNILFEGDVLRFLNNPDNVAFDLEKKTIMLSKLFQWFGKDFVSRYGNDFGELRNFNIRERAVLNFLASYMKEYRDFILDGDYTIHYADFDWTINKAQTI